MRGACEIKRRVSPMARVLILLPARDFDPSEAAVSWRVLADAGHAVSFATPDGRPAVADEMMLTGSGSRSLGRHSAVAEAAVDRIL